MQKKNFVITFVLIFFGFLVAHFLLVTGANAHRIYSYPWSLQCEDHQNAGLRKLDFLQKYQGTQAIVLGTSTSEPYSTEDIESLWGQKTFHGALPGSDSLGRLLILKMALQTQPQLKTVFYISDFYEFNQKSSTPQLTTVLKDLLPASFQGEYEQPIKERILHFYSNTSVEEAFRQFKKCRRQQVSPLFLENGMTTRPMVIGAEGYKTPQLWNQARQRGIHMHRHLLKKFNQLSPMAKASLLEVVRLTKDRNIQLIIVASPYHPEFIESLAQTDLLQKRREWVEYLHGLESDHVQVFDFESEPLFPGTDRFWSDGHHYRREGAQRILQQIHAQIAPFQGSN